MGTAKPAVESSSPASQRGSHTAGENLGPGPLPNDWAPSGQPHPAAPLLASVEGGAEGREAIASPWGEPPVLSPLTSWGGAKFKVTH